MSIPPIRADVRYILLAGVERAHLKIMVYLVFGSGLAGDLFPQMEHEVIITEPRCEKNLWSTNLVASQSTIPIRTAWSPDQRLTLGLVSQADFRRMSTAARASEVNLAALTSEGFWVVQV